MIEKVCTKCRETKPLESFHRATKNADGRRYACKACVKVAQRVYTQANAERLAAYAKVYYQANAETIAERTHKHRAQNKGAVAERDRRYRETPRGKAVGLAKSQRYALRATGAECGCMTAAAFGDVWDADLGLCVYCGDPAEHVDHVVPLAAEGRHCVANLRPACARCNCTKGARPVSYLLGRLRDVGVVPLVDESVSGLLSCPLQVVA